MNDKPHPRFAWAIGQMAFEPGDSVLEIGPGTGIALEMIAQVVSAGSVLALDKSGAMLRKAASRLKDAGLARGVTFLEGDALSTDLSRFRFDKVFAFNVNVFINSSDVPAFLNRVRAGGRVGVFFQNPPKSDAARLEAMLRRVEDLLVGSGLKIEARPRFSDEISPTGGIVAIKR